MLNPIHSRRQQKEERREQILDASVRVFSEKGFAGSSIRDIAKEVGVTEGLLYHYFDSKEQLMYTCWKERFWRAQMENILAASAGKSVELVLRELVSEFINTLRHNSEMVRMCAAEMQHNPEMAANHLQRIESDKQLIRTFLAERQSEGELRADIDLDTPTTLLMGAGYSMFLLHGNADDEAWSQCVKLLVTNGVDIIINGITGPNKV